MSIDVRIGNDGRTHFIYDEDELVSHLIERINTYGSMKGYDIEIDEYDDEWRKKIFWSFFHFFNNGGFEIKEEGERHWIDWLNNIEKYNRS